jgi:hypothetical protein
MRGAKMAKTAELQTIKVERVTVKIKGLSPLIMHRWSEKARREMLDKQMKKTVKKEAKSPEEQYESSVYRMDDGEIGFPADAFKKAMIRGAKQIGMVMTDARTSFFVHGTYCSKDDRELVAINGEVRPREDMVRLNGATADIRFRGQVASWSADLNISYNSSITSFDQIVNMLHAAGYGVGVGEWRPEKDGTFGRFEVIAK